MPMIKCPECGKEISDLASTCPNCGFPMTFESTRMNSNNTSNINLNNNSSNYNQYQTFTTNNPDKTAEIKSMAWGILAGLLLLTVVLAPIGMIIMWTKKTPKTLSVRMLVTAFFGLIFVFWLTGTKNQNKETDNSSVNNNIETQEQNQNANISKTNETTEQTGITGIEVQKSEEEKYGDISEFKYEISDNKIILDTYQGKAEILEIQATYVIDGTEYDTDLSEFQLGIGNKKVKTLIIAEGITEVREAIFNSCSVEKVYFPKTMINIYDYTLSYMHCDDGQTIKIYYGGTQEEWSKIFTEYKRTLIEDAESGAEMGGAFADKLNEMMGVEYDSSLFEYFFSANPEDLKENPEIDVKDVSQEENPESEKEIVPTIQSEDAATDNIFRVGDILETKKVKLSYLSCGNYFDSNMFVQAGEGNKFIYFEFEFENIGNTDTSVGYFDFNCYADGYEAKNAFSTADNELPSITTLSPNRKTKGIVVFEVPKNAEIIEVEYETSFWTQDKAIFIYE